MAAAFVCALATTLIAVDDPPAPPPAAGPESAIRNPQSAIRAIPLQESARPGDLTAIRWELKARGQYRPGGDDAKPLGMTVETRLIGAERVLAVGPKGEAQRVARRIEQAAAAINGEGAIRPIASVLRPGLSTLIVELRGGSPFAFSPAGPLTRPELDLVQGPGEPLTLGGLLPARPVKVGDRWAVAAEASRSLCGYDALAANGLQGTLEALDDDQATIKLDGEVRGAALGGEGLVKLTGTLKFDRKAGRISSLSVDRDETRAPGPVEAGLEFQSTLTLTREPLAEPPPELGDAAVAALPTGVPEGIELLEYASPNGKYTLLHDRDWHTFAEDTRRTVLRRLDRGELVAQCNLTVGPNAGPGKHQELKQFRDDVRAALGPRFVRFVDAGEVPGVEPGFRYRLSAEGKQGEVGIVWYYYLLAGPDGDQLVATFTLGAAQAESFAAQDLKIVGSLTWTPATTTTAPQPGAARP